MSEASYQSSCMSTVADGCANRKMRAVQGSGLRSKQRQATTVKKASNLDATSSRSTDSEIWVQSRETRFGDSSCNLLSGVLIKDLTVILGGQCLLNMTTLELSCGRYGFVAENGAGKTTLLRLMAEQKLPGFQNCSAVLIAQEDVGNDLKPIDAVLSASQELCILKQEEALLQNGSELQQLRYSCLQVEISRAHRCCCALKNSATHYSGDRRKKLDEELLKAEEHLHQLRASLETCSAQPCEDASEWYSVLYADVQQKLADSDEEGLRTKAAKILHGLGFNENMLAQPTKYLSGGWRMRVGLAKALLFEPELLLLDEPTNHLDWSAILWLETYLQSLNDMIVIIVSHDRQFLDKVSTRVLRLHNMALSVFNGNYSYYEQERFTSHQTSIKKLTAMQKKTSKVQEQVSRMEREGHRSGNSSMLTQAAARRKQLNASARQLATNSEGFDYRDYEVYCKKGMTSLWGTGIACAEALVDVENLVNIEIKVGKPLGYQGDVMQCRALVVGYPNGFALANAFDLDVSFGSRIALVGLNGCGKTTVLATMAKALAEKSGEMYHHPRLNVGYFSQHMTESLPSGDSPLDILQQTFPDVKTTELRSHLASFKIKGNKAVQKIGTMSGGEKMRVALASITLNPPHIMLLDEPTNHLDLLTVQALGEALGAFKGGIVLVSHDRWLLTKVCNEFYYIDQGELIRCDSLQGFVQMASGSACSATGSL